MPYALAHTLGTLAFSLAVDGLVPVDFATFAHVTETRSLASLAMDRYADGDESAFADVYNELAPRLYAYLRRLTRSESAAEDILQQTFLRMHQARARFTRGARVESWAYAIARRLFIDWAHQNRKPQQLSSDVVSSASEPDALAQAAELADALRQELETLPKNYREAFVLVRVEQLSVAEAAEILGVTAAAVKLRAHRAGTSLRGRLARFVRDAFGIRDEENPRE